MSESEEPLFRILSDAELSARARKNREDNIAFNQDLCKRATSRDQLLVTLDFKVNSISCTARPTRIAPRSEMVLGGKVSSYAGGTRLSADIHVSLIEANRLYEPIEQLSFLGWPSLRKGDHIRAHLYVGEKVHERLVSDDPTVDLFSPTALRHPIHDRLPSTPAHFVHRSMQSSEPAYRIDIICEGDIVASYHNPASKPT